MRKVVLLLVCILTVTSVVSAMELKGKFGIGNRADLLGARYFFSNHFAADLYVTGAVTDYSGTSQADYFHISTAGMYVKEICAQTLLQLGATLGTYQGASPFYRGIQANPFVGFEYMLGEHLGFDFKLFPVSFFYREQGSAVTRQLSYCDSTLGAHYYF